MKITGSWKPTGSGVTRKRRPNRIKHVCIFCDRKFAAANNLDSHLHTHTRERPFPCLKCDIWYRSFSNLWDHQRVFHLGIKWTCETCGNEFNALSNLCSHRRRMHNYQGVKGGATDARKARSSKKKIECLKKVKAQEEITSRIIKVKTERAEKVLATGWTKRSKTFKCKICAQLIKGDLWCLKRHMRRRHGGDEQMGSPEIIKPVNPKVDLFFARHHTAISALTGFPPLKLHNESVVASDPRHKDPSFFLHMNRYRPEESCFFKRPIVKVEHEPKKVYSEEEKRKAMLLMKKKTPVVLIKRLDLEEDRVQKLVNPEVVKNSAQEIVKREMVENRAEEVVKPEVEDDAEQTTLVKREVDDETKLEDITIKKELSNDGGAESSPIVKAEMSYKIEEERVIPDYPSISEPFKCKKCGNVLANKWSLGRHLNRNNCTLPKVPRPKFISNCLFRCPICSRDFGNMRCNMVRHIAGIHRYQKEEEDEEHRGDQGEIKPRGIAIGERRKYSNYSCVFCGLTTGRKSNLQEHILNRHHNELLGIPLQY